MLKIKCGRYPYHPNDASIYGIVVNSTAVVFEMFRFYLMIERSK